MARPREFDEDEVLDKALALFWARGYGATSIDELVRATGLGRASLYGAFGDKDQLFCRILERYGAKAQVFAERFLAQPSGRAGLEQFLQWSVENSCPSSGGRGCLATLTSTLPEPAETARAVAAVMLQATEQLLVTLIARAQSEGAVTSQQTPAALGRLMLVMLQGLSTSARAGRPAAELQEVAHQMLSLLSPA